MSDLDILQAFSVNRFTLALSGTVVPKPHEIERVAVAYGGGGAAILAAYGGGVENELSEGSLHEQFKEGVTEANPDLGIWIWEGVPVAVWSRDWEYGDEFEGFDFSRGTWRPATLEELGDLVAGVSPWGSAVSEEEAGVHPEGICGTRPEEASLVKGPNAD